MTTTKKTPSVKTGIKHTRFGSYDPSWKSPWEIKNKTRIDSHDLKGCVKEFFSILDIKEVSDNDVEFRPNYISSCRCLDGTRLNWLIERMKELAK